jgi:ABC-type nitrate/sulfonate/bicarbonate transport system ATPase subunit
LNLIRFIPAEGVSQGLKPVPAAGAGFFCTADTMVLMPKLQVQNVSKAFVRDGVALPVLQQINFAMQEGEFVSLLGPSGCGKSTLFNIIAGLLQPDTGSLRFDGKVVEDRRGMVAYMQQKDLLFPWRRVIDNTILGPELQHVSRRKARRMAHELLDHFGLQEFASAYPAELSGGMRQRVALIRTLLFNKDVMLLDEPFGALDAMTRSGLQRWLLQVWAEFGKTILFITHDVEEAVLLSDRIVVLSVRPGELKDDFEVALPRPRRVIDEPVVQLKGKLLELVQLAAVAYPGDLAGSPDGICPGVYHRNWPGAADFSLCHCRAGVVAVGYCLTNHPGVCHCAPAHRLVWLRSGPQGHHGGADRVLPYRGEYR